MAETEAENIFYVAIETKDRDDCEYLSKTYDTVDIKNPKKGAHGKVYSVCNKKTQNCNYVLKVIVYDKIVYEMSGVNSLSRASIKADWSRELRILKKLNRCQKQSGHKFTPEVYDAWFCTEPEKTLFYILMEKFEGDLLDFMKKYRSVPAVKVAALAFLQILDRDLRTIHRECNVCLNDIKLANILYKQIGEYEYQFVFADTGNSSEEITQKCQNDDQEKFRRSINEFKEGLKTI